MPNLFRTILIFAPLACLFAATPDIPLFHGFRWGMSVPEVKKLAKSTDEGGGFPDEFEMDGETTLSYRTVFSERLPLPVLVSCFFYRDRLFSVLVNYRSTNENQLVESHRETLALIRELYGKPKLSDGFRNLTAWETNGTVVSVALGPSGFGARKIVMTVQYDGPESPDIRLRLEKIRSEEFGKNPLIDRP